MKKIQIFGLIIIAVAIGIIVSTAGDASTYVDFTKAKEMAQDGDAESIHVVGTLKKDASGHIIGMEYQPQVDPNYFAFTLIDNNQVEQRVVYKNSKPQDFDKSEQVVVVGKMKDGAFTAEKILMKCPSKYENGKMETTEHTAEQS
ncbi:MULTISPECIES: cytochrome c maturation protein CcmE [Dyadobacter]|uniref:Cytochrome c maturation protein CcmE n=1 Tax=Dyadobacter chenhuakuii TaxID=2909339 RepID=A0ABY4XSI7_9BACT|nr:MULTISPECIES: cytochrome c maturation protein CcmE [Dyadobacter]MCE7069949.1 cytochrome c maturation protein CcmE [Dyadobacter sp. CY327]MCF2492272.1 cytochrome c maturation protein CcmE [Dyadobacter chenhuakuii]MCF2516915.1 cytochrome c maturation protein CcmE [Dyadobacter sp. CY351]USJ33421.1 cytochrome c maturation protein CcmE [Dyadobacter chenhuakuii]